MCCTARSRTLEQDEIGSSQLHPVGASLDGTSTVGAEDVFDVGEEALAHQRDVAPVAGEAVRVPVAIVERDELGAAQTCE